MIDAFLAAPVAPFTVALSLLLTLVLLEVIALLLGGSMLGMDGEAEFDLDVELDIADVGLADIGVDLTSMDVDLADYELLDAEALDADPTLEPQTSPSALTQWLGIGKVPLAIWIAALLAGFGASGHVLQATAEAFIGRPLPVALAALPALYAGIWLAKTFGSAVARVIPKSESTALMRRQLSRKRGVVSQGTARRGAQAEVRLTDRHGNLHYIRAEPLVDSDEIAQGTEVLVLRDRRTDRFTLVPLT